MQLKLFRSQYVTSVENDANNWLRENGALEIVGTQIAAAEGKVSRHPSSAITASPPSASWARQDWRSRRSPPDPEGAGGRKPGISLRSAADNVSEEARNQP
jgi:hypothetical protein